MNAPLIKICGLSRLSDIDAALSARATHIGLVFFAKSPRNVGIEQAAALAAHARGRAQVVGLFVDPAADFLHTVRAQVHLDAIQLHGKETPAQAAQIRADHGIELWKAIGVRKRADLETARDFTGAADRILYDAKPPGAPTCPAAPGCASIGR
jgi:phosphoribosylanthranilate isomerase